MSSVVDDNSRRSMNGLSDFGIEHSGCRSAQRQYLLSTVRLI